MPKIGRFVVYYKGKIAGHTNGYEAAADSVAEHIRHGVNPNDLRISDNKLGITLMVVSA